MPAAADAFAAGAADYDAPRRKLIPCFDGLYGMAADLLSPAYWPAAGRAEPVVVDLGAGTGLLSAFVRRVLPQARLVLLDAAPQMLAVARERFRDDPRVEFRIQDLEADAGDAPPLPQADAFVSALAIHHLSDAGKQALFRRLFQALRPGGIFVNIDQVAARSPAAAAAQHAAWLAAVRAGGADEAALQQALARMSADRNADAAEQLAWLDAAGFQDAEIWFRQWFFALFHARRPG